MAPGDMISFGAPWLKVFFHDLWSEMITDELQQKADKYAINKKSLQISIYMFPTYLCVTEKLRFK